MGKFFIWHHTYFIRDRSRGAAGYAGGPYESLEEAETRISAMEEEFRCEVEEGCVSERMCMDLYVVQSDQHECELPGHSGGCRECSSRRIGAKTDLQHTKKGVPPSKFDRWTDKEGSRYKTLVRFADELCIELAKYRTRGTGEMMAPLLIDQVWQYAWISRDPLQVSTWLKMGPTSYLARQNRTYGPMLQYLNNVLHRYLGKVRDADELLYVMGWVRRFADLGWHSYLRQRATPNIRCFSPRTPPQKGE